MEVKKVIWPALVAIVLGLLVLKWEWVAELFGIDVHIQRSGSMITIEYVWGMLAVLVLGYVFHKHPVLCGIWFVLGPTLITHSIYFVTRGVPNLWPVELLFLAVLTVPYVAIAYGAAYVRKRFFMNQP